MKDELRKNIMFNIFSGKPLDLFDCCFNKLLNDVKYNIKLRNQLLQLILMRELGGVKRIYKVKSQRKY